MGLRFRKSVTLCKGVRLNFGKTGTSLSVGGHGYRKTFHSSGRVTTSVGIPGTGIYWTDTKKSGKKKTVSSNNRTTGRNSSNSVTTSGGQSQIRDYSLDRTIQAENVNYDPVWMTETPDEELRAQTFEPSGSFSMPERGMEAYEEKLGSGVQEISDNDVEYLTEDYIHNIYVQCDESIDWGEILAGTSAEELMMDRGFWLECKKYCAKIMRGDTDTYLEVVETFRPVDDILLYAGEFEFGTDSSRYIETEFRVEPDELLEGGIGNPLFEDFVFAVSIRVARDLMALLPVKKVILHVVNKGTTFFSAIMDKGEFAKCDFKRESLKNIVRHMEYMSGIDKNRIFDVERKSLS